MPDPEVQAYMVANEAAQRIAGRMDTGQLPYAIADALTSRLLGSQDLGAKIAESVAEQLVYRLLGAGWIDMEALYDRIAERVAAQMGES